MMPALSRSRGRLLGATLPTSPVQPRQLQHLIVACSLLTQPKALLSVFKHNTGNPQLALAIPHHKP